MVDATETSEPVSMDSRRLRGSDRTRRHHGAEAPRGLENVPQSPLAQGFFGRMFRKLPAHRPPDDLLAFLAACMVEPAGAGAELDNEAIPAGYTYFGQFVDHDVTFDPTSNLQRRNDPDALRNFRTPRFDLDSLYASGPVDSPFLYENEGKFAGVKLLVGRNPAAENPNEPVETRDLPRNRQGRALIGDPRNDENNVVSQLQLAFVDFHNAVVGRVAADEGLEGAALFEEAQRQVRWHYQWVVVHDFLRRLVGEELFGEIYVEPEAEAENRRSRSRRDSSSAPDVPRIERRFYDWHNQPFMPVEFSGAAYRLGHSQVRPNYDLNGAVRGIPIFSSADEPGHFEDLRGFRPLPVQWTVDWGFYFAGIGDGANLQHTRLINPLLAPGLAKLPGPVNEERPSLAFLNLKRGKALGLPSGQAVAKAMGLRPLTREQLGLDVLDADDVLLPEALRPRKTQLKEHAGRSFARNTPLWFYALREAEVLGEGGRRLGPVGGRIVAEVLLGLLEGDPLSYLNVEPGWEPELEVDGETPGRAFEMAHLLKIAASGAT